MKEKRERGKDGVEEEGERKGKRKSDQKQKIKPVE